MGGNGSQLPPTPYTPPTEPVAPPTPPMSSFEEPVAPPMMDMSEPELAPPAPAAPLPEKTVDLEAVKSMIYKVKDELDSILRQLDGHTSGQSIAHAPFIEKLSGNEQIIEGVFNGLKMVGADGNEYDVPENYASKSKLVEGDMMKLTITDTGKFIYKQIGPIERKHVRGALTQDQAGQWYVSAEGRNYKVLNAAVSYHKGKHGDEATIIVPQDGHSDWAAVEHVIHMGGPTTPTV